MPDRQTCYESRRIWMRSWPPHAANVQRVDHRTWRFCKNYCPLRTQALVPFFLAQLVPFLAQAFAVNIEAGPVERRFQFLNVNGRLSFQSISGRRGSIMT